MPERRLLTILLAALVLLALPTGPATPAHAHGAPDRPLSRTLACAPGGEYERSEVCQAALAASGRASFDDWDYLRVPGVAGRDREVIPDGALCSGGIDQFAGLDLARDDWPATELVAGADVTLSYRTTIPHRGEFRLYLTAGDRAPEAPLTWSDLEPEPFLTVTDPEQVGDAYQLPGRLPEGKTGRHIIYTIWENSDTPDTYYSCSDVTFASSPSPPAGLAPSGPEPSGPAPAVPEPGGAPALDATGGSADPADLGRGLPWLLGGAAAVLVALTVLVALWRRRPVGHQPAHRRP